MDGPAICGRCGRMLEFGARFCPQCGSPVPSPNPTQAAAGLPPNPPGYQLATPLPTSHAPGIGMWALIGGGVAAALIIGLILVIGGGGGGGEASETEVFLVPATSVTPDRFTDSFAESIATTIPASASIQPPISVVADDAIGSLTVEGSTPRLYGGTRQHVECDPDKLVASLTANPDKATAWANVEGIEPSAIGSFVDGLTAVVLRRDTLVTNYGYRNGRAIPKQAVLQAGTAVLVDALGVPRTSIESGNPLTQPTGPTSKPRYRGAAWTGFAPKAVVRVSPAAPVEGLVLVDTKTNESFTRPVGSVGSGDGDLATKTCDLYPKDPGCGAPSPAVTPPPATPSAAATATATPTPTAETPTAPPTPTAAPTGDPVQLFTVYSLLATTEGPTAPSVFTFAADTYVAYVQTYHYGDTRAPGTIALESSDGTVYGPWQASGIPGQGGVDNANWKATVNAVIPAGEYTIVDSKPSTWSIAADTDGRGICWVFGYPPSGSN